MARKALVIAPGRGTYTKTELGYLNKHRPRHQVFVDALDARLAARGALTVSALDHATKFSPATHTPGENASTLIYACSAVDFLAIDRDRYEIVAVTGNSMGWYTALWCGGALDDSAGFDLVHTMGSMMKAGVIGGQLVYPIVGEDWRLDPERLGAVQRAFSSLASVDGAEAYISIRFGGYVVIGGNQVGLSYLMKALPKVDDDRYPFQLVNHAAFHTPLLRETSERAFSLLGTELFQKPRYPLVDWRCMIWQPYSTDVEALREYTLGHQVYAQYDFCAAVGVALKEFAPDCMILLGPGSSSGGALGQILVENRWFGINSKAEFQKRQESDPVLFAMGREDQLCQVANL